MIIKMQQILNNYQKKKNKNVYKLIHLVKYHLFEIL